MFLKFIVHYCYDDDDDGIISILVYSCWFISDDNQAYLA